MILKGILEDLNACQMENASIYPRFVMALITMATVIVMIGQMRSIFLIVPFLEQLIITYPHMIKHYVQRGVSLVEKILILQ